MGGAHQSAPLEVVTLDLQSDVPYTEREMLKGLLPVLALCWIPAHAATVYTNVGGGFPGDSGTDYSTSATFFGTTFTTSGGGNLNTLSLDLKGTTSPVTVGLYANSAGQPGTLLESWSATIPIGTGGSPPALTTLTSILNPSLSAATQYWLVLTQGSPSQITWFGNDTSVLGGIWDGSSIGSLSQVFGDTAAPGITLTSTVPEPTTWVLLVGPLAAMLWFERRRRA